MKETHVIKWRDARYKPGKSNMLVTQVDTDRYENLLSEILEKAELGLANANSSNSYALFDTTDALNQIKAMVERHQQYSFQELFDSMVDEQNWKDELDV